MTRKSLNLLAATMLLSLPVLQGCLPAVVVGGAAVGVMSAHDRRSTGTQTDDESIEWKAASRVPAQHKDGSHLNFTSYNRILLITGEVYNAEGKQAIQDAMSRIEGVRTVHNEVTVGPISSMGSRSTDSFIDSKVKARLVDSNQISANHIKVVTEKAVTHLMGIVTEREAKIAVDIARTTDGVRKVVNVMEILPDADIRRLDNQVVGARTPPPATAPVETR